MDISGTEVMTVPVSLMPNIQILDLEKHALERYLETPRLITSIRHADMDDDSEVFCIQVIPGPATTWWKRTFLMPKQMIICRHDHEYGNFIFVRVLDKNSSQTYWLITHYGTRTGFLLDTHLFSPLETEVRK